MGMPSESRQITQTLYTWMTAGDFTLDFSLRLDALSAVMILVVTGIGTLIHLYSTAYMHEESDWDYARFFSYLNLFCFFMLVLVLGSNVLVMFVGWEGVGLCSYLLIGFYYAKRVGLGCREEGVRGQPHRRLRVHPRHAAAGGDVQLARLHHHCAGGKADAGRGDVRHVVADHVIDVHRRDRQVGPDSALYLVARRDGRPDAGVGPDPRRHHGHRRRLHDRQKRAALRARADHDDDRRGDWRRHGAVCRHHRPGPERHQARAGVFDGVAAGLHVPGDGRRRVRRRHLPSLHARVLQGLPVPRLRRGDSRAARRAGHPSHGRLEETSADHLLDVPDRLDRDRRRAVPVGLFLERRNPFRNVLTRTPNTVGHGSADVTPHRYLHVPVSAPYIPR